VSFADENRIVHVKVDPSTGCKTTATVFGCVSETCPVSSDTR
jgi:hypothetical protein